MTSNAWSSHEPVRRTSIGRHLALGMLLATIVVVLAQEAPDLAEAQKLRDDVEII